MGNIRVEYLQEKHLDTLVHFYKIVFNRTVTNSYFRIKYGLEIKDMPIYATVIYVDDEMVGFHGAIEQVFRLKKELKLVQTCDFIISKEYRGMALFKELYAGTVQKAKRLNVDLLYGIHSVQSYKSCQRLGWKDELGFSRFHVKGASPITSKLVRKLFPSFQRKRLERALEPYLLNKKCDFKPSESYEHVYSDTFFEMKAFAKHYWVRIKNVILCLKLDVYASVGYVQFEKGRDVEGMLKILRGILKTSKIDDLVFHVHDHAAELSELAKFIEKEPSFKVSSFQLNETSPTFDEVKLNFMDMDIF